MQDLYTIIFQSLHKGMQAAQVGVNEGFKTIHVASWVYLQWQCD